MKLLKGTVNEKLKSEIRGIFKGTGHVQRYSDCNFQARTTSRTQNVIQSTEEDPDNLPSCEKELHPGEVQNI